MARGLLWICILLGAGLFLNLAQEQVTARDDSLQMAEHKSCCLIPPNRGLYP